MDRLTIRDCDNNISFSVDDDPEGAYDIIDLVEYGYSGISYGIANLLAEYEDTGLTPQEIEQYKRALELACDYKLNDSCPSAEENWEPPHKHLCAQCTGSDCIVCWGKYFLAQAKAGDK